jgi:hypothetical protein
MVSFLLGKGADTSIHAGGPDGPTALELAEKYRWEKIASMLRERMKVTEIQGGIRG